MAVCLSIRVEYVEVCDVLDFEGGAVEWTGQVLTRGGVEGVGWCVYLFIFKLKF